MHLTPKLNKEENFDESYLITELSNIVEESQDRYYDADEGISKCKQLLKIETKNFNVGLKFVETFKNLIENVIIIKPNSSSSSRAENMITFVAKFLANFIEVGDDEHIFYVTWKNIIKHLISFHRANCDSVRLRICQIFTKIFRYFDKSLSIPIDFIGKIKKCLIERIKDIKEDIQVEAISCMKYLQEPNDRFCEAISSLIFILENNGLSLKARLKILDVILINHETLKTIKKLIYYPDTELRLRTYDVLIDKVSLNSFDENYKIKFLKCILNEDNSVSHVYLDKLFARWLPKVDNNYLKLLSVFNFKKYLTQFNVKKFNIFIFSLFKSHNENFEFLREKFFEDCNLSYTSDLHILNSNQAFYFRCVSLFLGKYAGLKEHFFSLEYEKIFKQIQIFIFDIMVEREEDAEKHQDDLFILKNMLETLFFYNEIFDDRFILDYEEVMTKIVCVRNKFDEKLFEILFDFWKLLEPKKIDTIKKFLKLIIALEDLYGEDINMTAENKDLSLEMNQKRQNAVKSCLLIICYLLNDESKYTEMHSIVDATLKDLILGNISSTDPSVRVYAVRALGLCCLLSVDFALKFLIFFVKVIKIDSTSVVIEAQKALYNVLCKYKMNLNCGLKEKLSEKEYRDIIEHHGIKNQNNLSDIEIKEDFNKIIKATLKALVDQLDSLNRETKLIACEGFAKLFLAKSINNDAELLAKLLIILFDPSLKCQKGQEIKSCLYSFFSLYAKHFNLSIFDKLLIPLLSTIIDAPSESNIAEINLEELSNYLSLLTSQNEDDFRVHDQIVFNLIERINFELKLKTLKRFDKLVFFLMNFYNKSVHNRKNGDKVIKIYELVQLILENDKSKDSIYFNEFKLFSQFIKSCFNSLTTTKCLKRKIESDDDEDFELEEKKVNMSSIMKKSEEISKLRNKRKVSFDDLKFEKKLRL